MRRYIGKRNENTNQRKINKFNKMNRKRGKKENRKIFVSNEEIRFIKKKS